ncbi:PIF-3 [Homarus gammarus nudivirus]|uniref:PIF-3 n=1 Tax=Homarus gammarus nudivirus TaxID=2509616 RepID=A0A411HBC2_9VIRU|nr:PIF-3 [Homarus gammarus nudivirus]QBB28688.1 PIF-3 [Homarus gammarus nudivirus]
MDDRPSFFVYIILCTLLVMCFAGLASRIFNKTTKKLKNDRIAIKTSSLHGGGKKNCSTLQQYCFEDNDCLHQCVASTMSCVNGICINNTNSTEASNECNPSKGVIGYLIGNTAFGTYEYICKTVDPGIAISVDENRMCHGDKTYQIDYLAQYPSIYSCECEGKVTVPATSQKREHVECNPAFSGLVI